MPTGRERIKLNVNLIADLFSNLLLVTFFYFSAFLGINDNFDCNPQPYVPSGMERIKVNLNLIANYFVPIFCY